MELNKCECVTRVDGGALSIKVCDWCRIANVVIWRALAQRGTERK